MLTNKVSIGALTLSSLLMIVSPAYAVPTITIATDYAQADVLGELINSFVINFCEDPSSPAQEDTCHISLNVSDSAAIRDEIVNAGSTAVDYDLFISANPDSSDLYYKYQFGHPNVVVGKPFEFASDSVILYSVFPGVGIDVSSGFPKHLVEGVTFAIPDPVTDAYGAASARILSTLPNFKSALSHAQTVNDGITAYVAAEFYDPTQAFGTPFGFVPKSAACFDLKLPDNYSVYDFSQQENLKDINSVKVTGVAIGKTRNKEENAILNSFISYITGQSNGNGSANTAAYVLQNEYCYVPISSKLKTKDQPRKH